LNYELACFCAVAVAAAEFTAALSAFENRSIG
jgi:hypothetical protein